MPEDEDAVARAPCGACRTLRRWCVPRCVFSAGEFAAVHGVFGASNVSKMLEDIELPEQRRLAADTLVEEAWAWARARDPTFDCASYLRILQDVNEKDREQIEVDDAREESGSEVASEPVDVASAGPADRMEARAQVDAALQHEQEYRLLGGWGAMTMTHLAGATEEQQQHLVAQHAENEHGIILGHGHPDGLSQEILQLLELLDMAELSRKQQIIQKTEMGQYWDAAAGAAREQDLVTMMQQAPPAAWQHQYPAPQSAGIRGGFQEMPQLMEEACTAEFATRMGIMSQQFHSAQPYHDPAAARHASPWPAAASQVASEQDMLLLLLQQHQVAAAGLLSAGARQFDNVAAQYEDTEVTLGYGGHLDMHQQVAAAGQVAGVHGMNARHATAAVLAEREMTQLAAGAQHAQQGLDVALGTGHLDGETEAMLQELAALLEQAGKQETIRKQGVTTGMGQWDAVAGIAREQDVTTTTMTQQSPDAAAWLQVQEMLEQMEEASSTPEFAERLEIIARQAEARYAQKELGITLGNGPNGHPGGSTQGMLQAQELFTMAEMARKKEMIRNQIAAAALAREQEMIIAQQQHPVAMYSGTELHISLWQGHGHPYWHQPTVQQMLQEKQLPTVQQLLQEQQLADVVWIRQAPALHDFGGGLCER